VRCRDAATVNALAVLTNGTFCVCTSSALRALFQTADFSRGAPHTVGEQQPDSAISVGQRMEAHTRWPWAV
jgi:hypothetical protein